MDPSSGPGDRATAVRILGTGFQPLLKASYDDPSARFTVDSAFTARLGGQALTGVVHVSGSELRGSVPPGLSPGTHDLHVVDPRGNAGLLQSAFTVLAPTDGAWLDGAGRRDHRADGWSWPTCQGFGPGPGLGCGCGKMCAKGTCVCNNLSPKCSLTPTPGENAACKAAMGNQHCCKLGCCTHLCGCP